MQKNKLFHMSCENHAKTMQNAARTERQPAEPSLSPGFLLYVLYVLYLTRQATEHPLSPGSLAPGCISSEPTFAGLRKNKKKENKGSQKKGSPKKREKGFPLAKLDIA